MEIIRIVGKFWNCGIISSLLICEFLKICWDIFENFNVENLFYWIIGNVGIVEILEKIWNCGIHLHHGYVKKIMKIVKSVWNGKKWNSDEKWKLENDSALYDCVSHVHMHLFDS